MEPDRQIEIQLGHMCNNRCVFCVSGQRTAMREAFPVAADPIIGKLREGRDQGMRKVTLLGGEPTLQPEFLDVVRAAVSLGYEEIVLFTNGVKTAREAFVDEILATGGNFTWRLSFQGATALSHERTTRKLGSFGKLVETLGVLRRKGQRITVNMCVVQSNHASVAAFPELLLPYGVRQVHLDMVRPLDAGVRTEDEMLAMLPRYTDLAEPMTRMVEGFEAAAPGFDVNIGNLPYCVAPRLAPWIHHDGEATLTVAVDHQDALSEAWDKYLVKRRDKVKPSSCRQCVFDDQCSGVFDTYQRFHGLDEFVPVTHEALVALDPAQRLFTLHVRPFLARLDGWTPPALFTAPAIAVNSRDGEVVLRFDGPSMSTSVTVALRRGGRGTGGAAATDRFSLHLLGARDGGPAMVALLRGLFDRLCEAGGARVLHPPAEDLGVHGTAPRTQGPGVDWRVGQCLGRLRARAPFGELSWRSARVAPGGREAVAVFADPDGAVVTFTVAVRGAGVSGGYKLDAPVQQPPSRALVEGVRAVMEALREPVEVRAPAG